jgi:ABC-type multidrug transport system fused ATPase/permease subunit
VPHIKKYIPRYFGLLLLLILSSALSLPGPAIAGYIIDKVFIAKDVAKLSFLVGLLLTILLLSELVRIVEEYYMLRLSQEFTFSIRAHLIDRILRYPISFFAEFKTGYLVSRLDEVNLLGNYFSVTILSLAENLIRFLGAVFLISRYNLKLTIVSLLVLPLFFAVARRSVGAIRHSSLGAMEKNAEMRSKIQETLSGIEVIKTFAKESREANDIKSGLRAMIELEIIQNLFSSLSSKVLGIIAGINLLVILWVGGHEIMAGRLTVGQYFAFVAYIDFLYGPIQMFARTFLQFQRSFMASKRISEFLTKTAEDECPERRHEFKFLMGDIRFENVYHHYVEGKDILTNISFFIKRGEKVAFVGRSGAGKSTIVQLILGLLDPTQGRVLIDGIDSREVRLDSLRDLIGIVSQNIFLFDDSILNNIKYGRPEASIEDVIAAAKASGCHDFISRLSKGYYTKTGEFGKKLSGGEKQRISIARCILKNPDLLIFDEPAAYLDPPAVCALMDSIKDLFEGKTRIIISHNLNNVYWVDNIFVLEQGKIVQKGTHASLIKEIGEYQELFRAGYNSRSGIIL